MKCPHCQKRISQNKTKPEYLLAHIKKTLGDYERRKHAAKKYRDEEPPEWLQDVIDKWQAWADWVEKQIIKESEEKPYE